MTYVDSQLDSFLPEFFQAWPFSHLPSKLRGPIASKLRICSFRPGELIYPARELPSVVHCVVQERVRILGPTSYQSPTLAVAGQGTVIGWDSLLRRVAAGSVRAAITAAGEHQEVLTLGLSADEFETVALQHLMPVLAQRASLVELFDALSRCLAAMPTRFAEVNLKEVIQYIDREQLAIVQNWYPDKATAVDLSEEFIWLLSGGAPVNLPIGALVMTTDALKATQPSPFPVRLLGIDRSFLASALMGGALPSPMPVEPSLRLLPGSAPIPATVSSDAAARPPAAPAADPPVALDKNYPVRRSASPDPVEDVVACFGMICDRLKVPYRPDTLRRWLKQRSLDQFEPFDLCVRIAQAVGLNAEVVRFTPTAGGLNRLTTPALIQYRDLFAVLHEVTATVAVLGSPRTGLLRLAPSDLADRLSSAPASTADVAPACRAVILSRMPRTPVKRFGFNWFFPALAGHRSVLAQVLFASVFVQLLGVANPLLVQQIIDQVIISSNRGAMAMFGVLMVLFAGLEAVLTVLRTHLFASATHRVDLRLGTEIIQHLLRLPLNFFEKRPVGELSSRLSELENIRQFLTGTTLTAVLDVLFSVLYIGVMFLYSRTLTLCVLLTIPLVILSTLVVAGLQRKLIRAKSDHGSRVQSYLVEVLGGIFTVKAQHMETLVEATWRERYVQYLTSGFTTATVGTVFGSFSTFLNAISSLVVLWVGAELVLNGQLTLGGLIAFRILTGYVTGPMLRLARLWQQFQETSLSMELLADIVDFPSEELPQDEARLQLPPIQGRVQYHGVSFGFKPGQLQLANVDLDVPAGSFVGIVGQSGSGKSTLLKLLPRLYVPHSGSITIDGYDVNKVNLSSLREQIGIVPQDAVLFEGTIRDNIALFGDLSDEEVMAAAKVAEAHEFIMQLPDGYGTAVGERGSSLSGGQRQRVAIARAVARNPRLLIFDEATSALDYETERRVCENLMQRFRDRTCFFITHRLNTITQADRILFMQSGVIVEQGTHQDLMALRQLYYCLYTQQARL